MDQSSVSADSRKPYAFPFRKRNHKRKPVIPSSQFDYHNDSLYSLYNDINVKVQDIESSVNPNQMRITKETTIFGLSKNTATGNFESTSQRRLSTETQIGPI